VGGGVRYLPSFGEQGICVEGRPLRLQDAKCIGAPSPLSAAGSDTELAAAAYAADARMECVSISAFLQLALELRSAGAPTALVQRALLAAQDELRHTVLCGALAEQLGAAPASYALPKVCARPVESRQALLERLAVESYEDGCVGEAVAARQLVRSAALAADSGCIGPLRSNARAEPSRALAHRAASAADSNIGETLRAIARDEADHAQLAWDVLSFCVAEGGAPVRAALHTCARRVRSLPWAEDAAPDLQRFGRMQPGELAQLARAQVERAHVRAQHLATRADCTAAHAHGS
jgi:hypothetical protein